MSVDLKTKLSSPNFSQKNEQNALRMLSFLRKVTARQFCLIDWFSFWIDLIFKLSFLMWTLSCPALPAYFTCRLCLRDWYTWQQRSLTGSTINPPFSAPPPSFQLRWCLVQWLHIEPIVEIVFWMIITSIQSCYASKKKKVALFLL